MEKKGIKFHLFFSIIVLAGIASQNLKTIAYLELGGYQYDNLFINLSMFICIVTIFMTFAIWGYFIKRNNKALLLLKWYFWLYIIQTVLLIINSMMNEPDTTLAMIMLLFFQSFVFLFILEYYKGRVEQLFSRNSRLAFENKSIENEKMQKVVEEVIVIEKDVDQIIEQPSSMNYCMHCGEKIAVQGNFCPNCGMNFKTLQTNNFNHQNLASISKRNISLKLNGYYKIIQSKFYSVQLTLINNSRKFKQKLINKNVVRASVITITITLVFIIWSSVGGKIRINYENALSSFEFEVAAQELDKLKAVGQRKSDEVKIHEIISNNRTADKISIELYQYLNDVESGFYNDYKVALRQSIYDQGVTFYKTNSYLRAKECFEAVGNYQNSKLYIILSDSKHRGVVLNDLLPYVGKLDVNKVLLNDDRNQFLEGKWSDGNYFLVMKNNGDITYNFPVGDTDEYYNKINGNIYLASDIYFEITILTRDKIKLVLHNNYDSTPYVLSRQ